MATPSKVPLVNFNACLNKCLPEVFPEVTKCYEPCAQHLVEGSSASFDELLAMEFERAHLAILEGCASACSSEECLNQCK